jgi:hypothetical protein
MIVNVGFTFVITTDRAAFLGTVCTDEVRVWAMGEKLV